MSRFEVFLALANATIRFTKESNVWGPFGRFGWKFQNRMGRENPLLDVVQEAKDSGPDWEPFKAGIFGRHYDTFMAVADEYVKMTGRLGWW